MALLAGLAQFAPRAEAGAQTAARPTIEPLVTTEWLQGEIGRPDLVILQMGGAESFAKAHLPHAVMLEYERDVLAPTVEGGLRTELPSHEALTAMLRAKGVTATSRVVLVFDQTAAFARTGRAFFTLEWGGLGGRVAILDGGLPKWVEEGRPVEAGSAAAVHSSPTLVLAAAPHLRATRADVLAMLGKPGMRIVDARDSGFFFDLRDNQMPRGGHIPGAVNIVFAAVTHADGTLRSREELDRFVREAGIAPGESITTYCHIGVQASWLYFALRVLGRDVRMFDGSFDEWSRDASLPVEGARPRP